MVDELYRKPNVKDVSETKQLSQKMKDFLLELRPKIINNDIEAVAGWKDKMRIARNMRQGIKRQTEYPYPGAPDIPLPETDKIIRKHKPRFVLAVTSGKKFMTVKPLEGIQEVSPELKESAKKADMAMDFVFRHPKMEWLRKLALQADRFLEKGYCIFKIGERFSCRIVDKVVDLEDFSEEELAQFKSIRGDQKIEYIATKYGLDPEDETDSKTITRILKEFSSGKKVIKFKTEEVTSLPEILCPMPEKVFVPKGTTDIESAYRITNEFFWDEQRIVQYALKGILIKNKVFDAFEKYKGSMKIGDEELNEKIKDRIEGVDDSQTGGELYRMHETICWYQPEEKGPFERWLFLSFADIGDIEDALVQYMPYPYEYEGWNYVKHDNEIIDDRFRAPRGTPEQIRAIQEFMERSMNNMLIRDEINNAPMFTVKNTANLVSENIRFIPGSRIDVNDHDDIRQLSQASNVDVSSSNILSTLKAYAEEYVGITDQLMPNAANAGGIKGTGMMEMGIAEATFTTNLDILVWMESIRKVYEKVFYTMRERLTRPLIINNVIITKDDFNFIPDISVNGSIEMANKNLQANKAQMRLERARQAVQDGVATNEDLFRAYEDYYEKDGAKEPLDFVTDPKEIANEKITGLNNQIMQLDNIAQDLHAQIAEADNTLKQIELQTRRKNDGKLPGEANRSKPNSPGQQA